MARGRYERKRLSRDVEAQRARFLTHCVSGPQGFHEPRSSDIILLAGALAMPTFTATCRHCYRSVELLPGDLKWYLRQCVIQETPLPDTG